MNNIYSRVQKPILFAFIAAFALGGIAVLWFGISNAVEVFQSEGLLSGCWLCMITLCLCGACVAAIKMVVDDLKDVMRTGQRGKSPVS